MFSLTTSFSRQAHALLLLLLLSACTTLRAPAPLPAGEQRIYHPAIELAGRLSVRYQKNGNEEALHGSFHWEQRSQRTIVTLLSPLGQAIARIDIMPDAAMLTEPGKAPRIASDVNTLTLQTLGWPLPVAGLRDWLQGFAVTTEGQRFIASPGTDSVITQDGWQLHYVSWQESGQQLRPRRLDLERYTEQAGNVALRIVIDNWQAR